MDREFGHLPFDPRRKATSLLWTKTLFVGNPKSGKTALIKSLCESKFESRYLPTIGADYGFTIQSRNKDGKKDRIHLWDLSGNDMYKEVRTELYADVDILFVVYDVTDRQSFISIDTWLREFKENANREHVPVIILANKCDLAKDRVVAKENGEIWATSRQIEHFDITATDFSCVKKVFSNSIESALNKSKRK